MKKSVRCGDVIIGGDSPVSIQSMTNTDTRDAEATLGQIKRLEDAGCEIVRVAVPDAAAAAGLRTICEGSGLPVVADIHFDYRLALASIEAGVDKIRINPGNIGSRDNVRKVAEAAGAAGIPVRVGVNSGSLEKSLIEKYGGVTAEGLAESAVRNAALLEEFGFDDIVLSIKASDVKMNFEACRLVDGMTDYPLHIGVTESGTPARGKVKSAVGIGAMLLEGIGDTMRVSLTADPVEEVLFARRILDAAGLRREPFEIVSCPTCGRTEVDLESIASDVERRMEDLFRERKPGKERDHLRVAVMGCVVNGPGEAGSSDIGVACGKGKGVLFVKGRTVRTVPEEDIAEELCMLAGEYMDGAH